MTEIIGYQQLQNRLSAIEPIRFGTPLMKKLGAAAVAEQKLLEAPHRKTGVTGASIHFYDATPTSVITEVGGAGRFLEFGTRPHVIRPRNARVLAWGGERRLSGRLRKGASATNFATVVHHPGTQPSPFMVPGAEIAITKSGVVANAIVDAWNKAG